MLFFKGGGFNSIPTVVIMFQHSTLCDRFLITNNNLGLPKAENFDFLEPGNAISIKEIHLSSNQISKKKSPLAGSKLKRAKLEYQRSRPPVTTGQRIQK